MGALKLQLYNDITNRRLVQGEKNTSSFLLPPLYQEDQIAIVLKFLAVNPDGNLQSNPYTVVDRTGLSVVIKIGDLTTGAVLASQATFTPGATENTLTAVLNLNTTAMAQLFVGSAPSVQKTFEIELDDGTGKFTTFQGRVTINKELIRAGTPSAVPITNYPTTDQAKALFVKKIGGAGESIMLTSPDGTKGVILYYSDDGEFKQDHITLT